MSTSPISTNQVQPVLNRPSPVAVGTIIWLASEVMFFAALFAMYFSLRGAAPDLWASETGKLNVFFATINTLILVASSVTCQFGVFAAERLQGRRTGPSPKDWGLVEWFFLSYLLGAFFIAGQVFEYATLAGEGLLISTNGYGSIFYLTTGFHGLHVTVGLMAFLLVIGRAYSARRFTHRQATTAIVVSYYWHFVDVIWIALFFIIYVLQ
ncbi:MAG TPA: heme-copper oxidase subunit III [Pseudoclavibacter sp.]|nr:heme-copper oxidase subunit III [Pseudoclavibacter sp.]